jgi:hypothetical protein
LNGNVDVGLWNGPTQNFAWQQWGSSPTAGSAPAGGDDIAAPGLLPADNGAAAAAAPESPSPTPDLGLLSSYMASSFVPSSGSLTGAMIGDATTGGGTPALLSTPHT